MKRPFKILLIAAVAVCFALGFPCASFATLVETENGWVEDSSIDTSWFNYMEPKQEYTISTEAQLRGLACLVNDEQYLWKPNRNESFEDVTFVLTRDITLTSDWTPIGVDDQINFCGEFDGKGHTITGVDVKGNDPNKGFFGYLNGTVRNLNIQGSVNSTSDFCGGMAGYLSENGRIVNCSADVQVAGRNEVGGVAGESCGTLIRCINHGEVIGASMVGGIVGESRGGTVRRCGNRGLVYSNGAGSFNNGTGGVAGKSVSASNLRGCYNTGDVISSNEATGGITGYTNSSGSSIVNCYSIGSIRMEKAQVFVTGTIDPGSGSNPSFEKGKTGTDLPVYSGGIAGYVGSQTVVIRNCYNSGKITGADYAGGIIGKCENEMYSADPPAFRNNYYGKGTANTAIAADRDNKKMKIRGAATEVYDSAFGHLASSLGQAYMDDKAGEYGSLGYPVLVWQEPMQSENHLAVLKHIDPAVLKWLHNAKLALDTGEFSKGKTLLMIFDPSSAIQTPEKMEQPAAEKDPHSGSKAPARHTILPDAQQTQPTKGPNH